MLKFDLAEVYRDESAKYSAPHEIYNTVDITLPPGYFGRLVTSWPESIEVSDFSVELPKVELMVPITVRGNQFLQLQSMATDDSVPEFLSQHLMEQVEELCR